ncbi:MAG: apolipoprotein N-acyltransferase [Thermoflexales bacterium]|nr:apolipoprotein N-acyltransferase [Thermoflexales bacterium]
MAILSRLTPADRPSTRSRRWISLGLSALSGVLLTLSMPGFDVPFIGWVALVPLLSVLLTAQAKHVFPLALPFGVIFSSGVHNWYPNIFPPALGYFLIFAVGTFYAGMLQVGVWLYTRLPAVLKVLGLPVAWAAIEFVKYIAPVAEDWWFVLLADSQWRFPAALQPLSVTGVFGVSFLVMLVNVSVASLIITRTKIVRRASLIALAVVALIVIGGALSLPQPDRPFNVAVLTDMVNQDARVLAQGEFAGTRVQSAEVSQAIFDTDAALTQQIAAQHPDFVVWPENEFSSTDDPQFIAPLKTLAAEVQAYFTVDTAWSSTTGLHDTALLIGPDGAEVGRRAKINLTSGEAKAGFVPGPIDFPVFQTPYGQASIAICWDVHRLWIIRELARAGAQIILLPMDNDFNGVPTFPPFHAADAVFRAVENHLAFGLGTVNGVSMVIDPYGRITAEGKVNERGALVGETFVVNAPTIYTRFGDWFGWAMVIGLIGLVALSGLRKNDRRNHA